MNKGKFLKRLSATVDPILLFSILGLLSFGLVMVASSSFEISQKHFNQPFHYLTSQGLRLVIGIFFGLLILSIPLRNLEKYSKVILLFSIVLLMLVFIPGVGRQVNGSIRWIGYGIFRLQVSEFAKLGIIIYLSRYLVEYHKQVHEHWIGFFKPMLVVGIMTLLLIAEPDFGAAVVVVCMALSLLYLGGVSIWMFVLLLLFVSSVFALLAVSSPYRILRLTSFLNPWATQFDSGYQLTQSLIAFGRGGWFGTGLGESIQKLFYLPEAHTDFIFAVIAEELGLIGSIVVIMLYILLFWRGMFIGFKAHRERKHFNGYLAQGITLYIGVQMLINIGVNTGLLPTKGLTLPLISYGGSSMVVNCIALALLVRVDMENT